MMNHSTVGSGFQTPKMILVDWVDKKKYKLSTSMIYKNPNALHFFDKNPEKINWFCLSQNPNPAAINLIEQYPDKINLDWLSANPSAMRLLEKNFDRNKNISTINWDIGTINWDIGTINWDNFSRNPGAISFLEQYPDNINWHCLSQNINPSAVELL